MADFLITINNALTLFGPQDTNKWNQITWGVDNWGYGIGDLPVDVFKDIFETLSLDSSITTLLDIGKTIENSLSLSGDMYDEYITDENGYYRLFGDQANAENRAMTSYNSVVDQSSTYTSVPRPSTSYTQLT